MSKLDQIDDYLSGRLEAGERRAFEQALESDPQLKAEVAFQHAIIKGVQKARAAELKAMLSNVPVPPAGGTAAITAGKLAAIVITAGIVGSAIYFGVNSDEKQPSSEPQKEVTHQPVEAADDSMADEANTNIETKAEAVDEKEITLPDKKDKTRAAQPVKPKIEVADPTQDVVVDNSDPETNEQFRKESVSVSSIEVETNNADRKHEFHYQFHGGKLILYGPFDEKLYEIIEINGEKHSIFLYYNQRYYLLNQSSTELTPLAPITDRALTDKLNEYRNN